MMLVEPRRGKVPLGEDDGQDWLDGRFVGQGSGRTAREFPERGCFVLAQIPHHGCQGEALNARSPDMLLDSPEVAQVVGVDGVLPAFYLADDEGGQAAVVQYGRYVDLAFQLRA